MDIACVQQEFQRLNQKPKYKEGERQSVVGERERKGRREKEKEKRGERERERAHVISIFIKWLVSLGKCSSFTDSVKLQQTNNYYTSFGNQAVFGETFW